MNETRALEGFCLIVQRTQQARGWRYAEGLSETALDTWERRLNFTFPPEMRTTLQIGFPVRAPAHDRRNFGISTIYKKGTRTNKAKIRVGKWRIDVPMWLGRRRPFVEPTYTHTEFVDWHDTSQKGVDGIDQLIWTRQSEQLAFEIRGGHWPMEWGSRPSRRWDGDHPGDPNELSEVVAERLPEMPPLVPLDTRTFMPSSPLRGMPVYQYWFGQELHVHAFDLVGALARQAGLLPPPEMRRPPKWGGFWSQFASLDNDPADPDSTIVKRQHDAFVAYCRGSERLQAVYRSFHQLYSKDEEDPDLDRETGWPNWARIVHALEPEPPPPGH